MGSGEEAGGALNEFQRAILTAVCDTVVPSIERERDPDGLWARKASDLGVDAGAAQLIEEIPDPELCAGLVELLMALGAQGITRASQPSREQILRNAALSDPRAAAGVAALIGMTLFLHYGAPDRETGKNPNPGDVLARRPDADRGWQCQPRRRHHAGRRHDDQLDQLPPHPALGPRAVGEGARSRRRRRPRLRSPSRRRLEPDLGESRLQRPERSPAAASRGG